MSSHLVPYAKSPTVVKQRRGDPTPAEMQLLAQAVKTGDVVVKHPRGHEQPRLLALAFEMTERGWLTHEPIPEVVQNTRVWKFYVTDDGRKAYEAQMSRFGVKV